MFLSNAFGIETAQEVFQEIVAKHFGDITGVETYIDDILVWVNSNDKLQKRPQKVLDRCKQIG